MINPRKYSLKLSFLLEMVATIVKALILELDDLGDLNRGGNG